MAASRLRMHSLGGGTGYDGGGGGDDGSGCAASAAGGWYLKAPVAGLAEAPLPAAVARLYPAVSQPLVATSARHAAFVTRGFVHAPLGRRNRDAAVAAYERLQCCAAADVEELLAAGAADLRPARLGAAIATCGHAEGVVGEGGRRGAGGGSTAWTRQLG